jgi:hypothetical protein
MRVLITRHEATESYHIKTPDGARTLLKIKWRLLDRFFKLHLTPGGLGYFRIIIKPTRGSSKRDRLQKMRRHRRAQHRRMLSLRLPLV